MVTTLAPNGTATIDGLVSEEAAEREQFMDLLEVEQRRHFLTESEPEAVRSIFDQKTSQFTKYRVDLTFRGKVMGGTPTNAKLLEGHIRAKAGVTDAEEVRRMIAIELAQGVGLDPNRVDLEALVTASEKVAAEKSTNGFRRDAQGLFLPGRYAKALLKEVCNIAFAGERWGATRKGPKNFLSENVFVCTDRLYLGRTAADGVDLIIGHVSGPQGPQSTLAYHEYILNASTSFTVESFKDRITVDQWMVMLELGEREGLGACRSQGYGTFAVTNFEQL